MLKQTSALASTFVFEPLSEAERKLLIDLRYGTAPTSPTPHTPHPHTHQLSRTDEEPLFCQSVAPFQYY